MNIQRYQLDNNYINNLNIHLNNLNNNSSSIISDLNKLEELLVEIHTYNNKGLEVSNIINLINTHNNDLKLCLNEVYNNIKEIDNKFLEETIELNNKTNTIIKKIQIMTIKTHYVVPVFILNFKYIIFIYLLFYYLYLPQFYLTKIYIYILLYFFQYSLELLYYDALIFHLLLYLYYHCNNE